MTRALIEQMLEAMNKHGTAYLGRMEDYARPMQAAREWLAQPEQSEPHAWLHDEHHGWVVRMPPPDTGEGRWYPVYTAAPPLRKLSDGQEPVAYVNSRFSVDGYNDEITVLLPVDTPLYTAPPLREPEQSEPVRREVAESGSYIPLNTLCCNCGSVYGSHWGMDCHENGEGSTFDSGMTAPHLRELSEQEILDIAHGKASKYTHRSDPTSHSYGFVKHTLLDFVNAILAAARSKT